MAPRMWILQTPTNLIKIEWGIADWVAYMSSRGYVLSRPGGGVRSRLFPLF